MQVRGLIALVLSTGLGAFYVAPFVGLGDGARHLPGRTSDGHHQLETECAACHDALTGATNARCLACHGADLADAEDSHSEAKFRDPRNADRIAAMNAAECTTCHAEHTPGRTRVGGVTVPADFCVRCHEDVGRERPSHSDYPFDGCAASGCHNFHDNRALYRDYLVRHADEPDVLPVAVVPVRSSTAADPDPSARCEECHAREREGFLRGRHGMRLAKALSPMSPRRGAARVPRGGPRSNPRLHDVPRRPRERHGEGRRRRVPRVSRRRAQPRLPALEALRAVGGRARGGGR